MSEIHTKNMIYEDCGIMGWKLRRPLTRHYYRCATTFENEILDALHAMTQERDALADRNAELLERLADANARLIRSGLPRKE